MTAPTWADRSLPLAERVRLALLLDWDKDNADGRWDARDELLADIAAADRLARADWAVFEAALRGEPHSPAKRLEYETAMDAYRARMAQGVARG